MATIAQIKAAADNWMANNSSKLEAVQNDYYAAHGCYWQGIATPTSIPDNGAQLPADYTLRPTDQLERWEDVFTGQRALGSNLAAQVQIDVYEGPQGWGWSVTLRVTKDGITYSKTWNFGPETWRATDWVES